MQWVNEESWGNLLKLNMSLKAQGREFGFFKFQDRDFYTILISQWGFTCWVWKKSKYDCFWVWVYVCLFSGVVVSRVFSWLFSSYCLLLSCLLSLYFFYLLLLSLFSCMILFLFLNSSISINCLFPTTLFFTFLQICIPFISYFLILLPLTCSEGSLDP